MNTPLRVLIVEDSDDDALLLVRELSRSGYDPTWIRVQNPQALQSALGSTEWDVIISDFSMPGFTGIDALRLVRSRDRETPFIFVSGTIGEDVAVDAMRAGAQDYVSKGNLKRLGPAIGRELLDVTERKRTAAALRAAQEHAGSLAARLERVLESVPDVLYSVDAAVTECYYMSPACITTLGYRPDEFMTSPSLWGERVHEDDRAAVRARRERVLEQRRQERLEYRIRHRDGSIRWLEDEIVPVTNDAGVVERLDGIARDITERRRLEEQFRQAQKMEAVGRLAGGVAHDFNNLLTVITSYVDLLVDDLPANDSRRQDLREVAKAAAAAAGLTRQLLAFSRQQVLEPRVLDLNGVVAAAGNMLKRLIGDDIVLATVLARDLGRVKADPGQVEQVIMNLAVNARDAMPNGGQLTIETANTQLDATYTMDHTPVDPGAYVQLSVSDTGAGMDAATQRRMFEPFFTTKEVGKGTGLGLATVYGIVKQSGGFIWVYSEPGQGTTFKIYLPSIDEPRDVDAARGDAAPSLRGTETVLLVEDADPLRAVCRRILERHGYTVLDAPGGRVALERARGHPGVIDLLMTDAVMPGMSGRQLAEQLKEFRPEVKVLFVSGYTDDAVIRHGILAPGMAFLQKPFSPEVLARRVREVLDVL